MAWKQELFPSIRTLAFNCLDKAVMGMERATGAGFVWRGEPEPFSKGILPRIDRGGFLAGASQEDRVSHEIKWYEEWASLMAPLMLPHQQCPPLRPDGYPNLEWLNFAAHHGCQTRLVDWSTSPWVALYFACCQPFNRPGRVWCFDADELAKVIGPRWDAWEVPFLAEGERDIEKSAFTAQSHRWLTPQFNVRSPLRMASQQGLFTIASRLGEPHDRLIDELVPDGAKFVITIPPGSDKIGLLGFLRSMGVHHESLHYPMLDHIAAKIENAPARSRD